MLFGIKLLSGCYITDVDGFNYRVLENVLKGTPYIYGCCDENEGYFHRIVIGLQLPTMKYKDEDLNNLEEYANRTQEFADRMKEFAKIQVPEQQDKILRELLELKHRIYQLLDNNKSSYDQVDDDDKLKLHEYDFRFNL